MVDAQIGASWSDKTSIEAGGRVDLGLDGAYHAMLIRSDNVPVGIGTSDYVRSAE